MKINLLSLAHEALDGSFLRLASQFFGEPTGPTQSAVSALLPAVFGATAQRGATPCGAAGLLSLLDSAHLDTSTLVNAAGLFGGSKLADLLKAGTDSLVPALFGDKSSALARALSSTSGIKGSSAASLIAIIVPLALTLLKRVVGERRLNASALATLLGSQRPYLQGAIDNRISSALGFARPGALLGAPGTGPGATTATGSVLTRWLPWWLGIIAAVLIFWILLSGKTALPAAAALEAAGANEATVETKPPA